MYIWILKYTADHLTYSCTAVLGTIFVLGVSASKLVYFLDLLSFKSSIFLFVNKTKSLQVRDICLSEQKL